MERLMVGRTTLVVAHRLSTVRALDRLLVLDKGKVIEEGSHEALIQLEKGLYRRLFERQALELIKGLSEPDVRRAALGANASVSASARQIDDSEMLVGE
jgi:ATP-binding cassette subfamily B protein